MKRLSAGLVTEIAPGRRSFTAIPQVTRFRRSSWPSWLRSHLRGNKRALLDQDDRTLEEHLALEAQIQADCIRSADFREGLDAFQNKRRPVFLGK